MKEEIKRIMRLVQEGKLSPEDAAELIDAFTQSEEQEAAQATAEESAEEAAADGETPPPPPGEEGKGKDPFRSFVDFVENIGKEVSTSVNWQEVAKQVRESAQKSVETIKESVKSGKVDFGWFSAHETKDITLPISVPEGKTLRVENPCGDVKVSSGFDEGSLSARARIRGANQEDARAKADAYTVIVEESEHVVLVRQPEVSGLDVDLVIQLAEPAAVEIRTQSGDVRIADTGKGARVNSQSGDVSLRGLNGTIDVTMQSGDLTVEESETPSLSIENKSGDIALTSVSGNVNARTASGDINARRCVAKTFSAESVSGDVTVDIAEPTAGSVNIRTVNGSANLTIPDLCDCRVSLSTLRGEVSSSVELQDEARMEQRITGRLGDGTGTIDVSAINGDISLEMRDASDD